MLRRLLDRLFLVQAGPHLPPAAWRRGLGRSALVLGAFTLGLSGLCSNTVLYVGYGLSLLGILVSGLPWYRCPVRWLTLALALCLVIAHLCAPYGDKTRVESIVYALPLLIVGWCIGQHPLARRALLTGVVVGLIASAVVAVLQLWLGYAPRARPWRIGQGRTWFHASGLMAHTIRFGATMAMAWVVTTVIRPRRTWLWALWWLVPVMAGGAVVASRSRGALLALVAGLWARVSCAGWRRAVMGTGLALVAAILVVGLVHWQQPGRARHMLTGQDARIQIWQDTTVLIARHPLTGVGSGAYKEAYTAAHDAGLVDGRPYGHAHNSFLGLAATSGLPALLLLLALLGQVLWLCWRRRQVAADGWSLGLGVLAVFVVGGMTEDLLGMAISRGFAFTVLGLALGWPDKPLSPFCPVAGDLVVCLQQSATPPRA